MTPDKGHFLIWAGVLVLWVVACWALASCLVGRPLPIGHG